MTAKESTTSAESQTIQADICIIGGGAGGLALAAAAVAFGQRVVVVEKHKLGGQSLNYGSVPLQALLATSNLANAMRTAASFGIRPVEPQIDQRAVQEHIKDILARLSLNVTPERFAGIGVRVIPAVARFIGKAKVAAGDVTIEARRFVIATGSTAVLPNIPGLADVPYLTPATLFSHAEPIAHLIVIGAGQRALELSQAYRRLGSRVTVLDKNRALPNVDPELGVFLLNRLYAEGIDIRDEVDITRVSGGPGAVSVEISSNGTTETIEGSEILLVAERKPNLADLGLDSAGIRLAKPSKAAPGAVEALRLNAALRTTNRRVYAIGEAAGGAPFAHVAEAHAAMVLKRILFGLRAKAAEIPAPAVVFGDPELAHVGLNEEEARRRYGRINALRWPYYENDRAQADRQTTGLVKVLVSRSGEIIGATIVGARASELIQCWALAISAGLKIKAMTAYIPPYPTYSQINRTAAFRYYATAPGNPVLRKIIALVAKLG